MRATVRVVNVLTLIVLASVYVRLGALSGQGPSSAASIEGTLPADVDPDSRNRLPSVKPGVEGAAAIRLHVSGVSVRWASPLGRALTELAGRVGPRRITGLRLTFRPG